MKQKENCLTPPPLFFHRGLILSLSIISQPLITGFFSWQNGITRIHCTCVVCYILCFATSGLFKDIDSNRNQTSLHLLLAYNAVNTRCIIADFLKAVINNDSLWIIECSFIEFYYPKLQSSVLSIVLLTNVPQIYKALAKYDPIWSRNWLFLTRFI